MAQPNLEDALHTALSAITPVTDIVGTQIRSYRARETWDRPYITYEEASSVTPNIVTSDMINSVFRIHCFENTPALARVLEDAVYDGLHESTLTIAGWTNYWLAHEGRQHLIVDDDGTVYFHYIGDYRIKADNQ